ncbi:MAG: CapA family protein [Syntrophomonadaceae bacterium]
MAYLLAENNRGRNPYWDNIKGILIFLVVFGHYLYAYWDIKPVTTLVSMIYVFHMPAFVFVSGFFSKGENAASVKPLVRLAVAYLLFNTAMMIYAVSFEGIALSILTPYYSYWYLLALIFWRLTVRWVSKIRGILIVSTIVALLIGFWSDVANILALSRIICFYPFFLAGYLLPTAKFECYLRDRNPKNHLMNVGILFLSMSAVVVFTGIIHSPSVFEMMPYEDPNLAVIRLVVFLLAALMIFGLLAVVPGKSLPLITEWGRNSLAIFLIHRFFPIWFAHLVPSSEFNGFDIVYILVASSLTTLILGSKPLAKGIDGILDALTALVVRSAESDGLRSNLKRWAVLIIMILILLLPLAVNNPKTQQQNPNQDTVYPKLTAEQTTAIDGAITIAYVGDLILLQDQVRNAFIEDEHDYDFSPMFEYAAKYLSGADMAMGVLEGPLAGGEAGYSTGNYDDGLNLYLNFPDSFVSAIKNSGIDFVTTATNHVMDQGIEGAYRTLEVLENQGLDYTGSFRDQAERETVKLIELKGLRIAVLAYTFGSNYVAPQYFWQETPYLVPVLAEPGGEYFQTAQAKVREDFERAQSRQPDLIIVMPHMGTQFTHVPDDYQRVWNEIFIQSGADIILGDHPHSVQPIEYRKATSAIGVAKQVLIVNCPGNFANSYTEHEGDASAIVEIYLRPEDGKVVGTSVIPMWTQSPLDSLYRALPIYDLIKDPRLRGQMSTFEMTRISEVQQIVTDVMLGARLSLDQLQERYFLFPEGYYRQPVDPLDLTPEMQTTDLFRLLSKAKSVCFVGDSITAGTKNGGYGWYESLMEAFPAVITEREAWGSATTVTLLENSGAIAGREADLYVIAIGTNDVRYRAKSSCAMTPQEYIQNIDLLVKRILEAKPAAKVVFISPWLALDNDPNSALPSQERDTMLQEYGEALAAYCGAEHHTFIDPNPALRKFLVTHATSPYLLDHIHPTADQGIELYSRMVAEY